MHCLRSYFVCQSPDSGYFSTTWLLKQVKHLSEQGKLLFAELGRDFLEMESKGYIWQETVGKKRQNHEWKLPVTYLTPGKPNIIKRVLSQLQGRWRRLKIQWKRTMTYIVVKSEQRHKKVKSEVKKSVQHHKTFSWYQPGSLGMTGIILFVRSSPWNLVTDCACSKYRYTPN